VALDGVSGCKRYVDICVFEEIVYFSCLWVCVGERDLFFRDGLCGKFLLCVFWRVRF
jgi:hypothetical protein